MLLCGVLGTATRARAQDVPADWGTGAAAKLAAGFRAALERQESIDILNGGAR